MFKGIYNVYSVDLQLSAVKITPMVGKNRAHQSYLILNRQIFLPCDRDRSRMAETEAPFTIARRWNDFLECPKGTARSTAFARAKSFQRIAQKKKITNFVV